MSKAILKTIGVPLLLLQSVSCAQLPSRDFAQRYANGNHGTPIAVDVSDCRNILGRPSTVARHLDSSAIRLVNWNTRKGQGHEWWRSVEPILGDADLALLQEAAFADPTDADAPGYFSFAPGFSTRNRTTGVMTVSAVEPLARCNLTVDEPWLGTPKAMSVTEFALSGTTDTLVVVNVHAINFAFGLRDFEAQLASVFDVLRDHQGPLVISGDFNTWRAGRADLLNDWTVCHGLTAVGYEVDHRATVFGQHLDQIFIRGLSVADATTVVAPSSDHNPMLVTLAL